MLYVLGLQCATFVALGAWFISHGNWRLGVAQVLLAVVQAVIYSGGLQ
jgi:hypothetical protein